MKNAFVFLFTTAALMVPALAQVPGPAGGLPEASVEHQGRILRLFGVTGLSLHQNCLIDGRLWGCGVAATRALQTLLDGGAVSCVPPEEDQTSTTHVICKSPDGDVASMLVAEGWALADSAQSDSYTADQERAQEASKGIWQGEFEGPLGFLSRIDAIEHRYAELTNDRLVAETSAVLSDLSTWMPAFAEAELSEPSEGEPVEVSLLLEDFQPGFLLASIEPPAVFDWTDIASVLAAHRQAAVSEFVTATRDAVWTSLNTEPAEDIETTDAQSFLDAMRDTSADWIEQGDQPVLLVTSPSSPSWLGTWFSGEPPEDAEVSKSEDITTESYIGTIDGVDVYVGNPPVNVALLTTSEKLSGLEFAPQAEGEIVAVQETSEGSALTLGLQVGWSEAPLVRLNFPEEQAGDVYGSP